VEAVHVQGDAAGGVAGVPQVHVPLAEAVGDDVAGAKVQDHVSGGAAGTADDGGCAAVVVGGVADPSAAGAGIASLSERHLVGAGDFASDHVAGCDDQRVANVG